MIWLIGCIVFSTLTVVAVFVPRLPAALTGLLALCCSAVGNYGQMLVDWQTLIFWGVATAMVIGLHMMLPPFVTRSRAGVPYISGGALAGTAVGMVMATTAAIICGAALGAFMGALAYWRTPKGRPMLFPSSKFFNYLAAKGLPAVVALSMTAIALCVCLKNAYPAQ